MCEKILKKTQQEVVKASKLINLVIVVNQKVFHHVSACIKEDRCVLNELCRIVKFHREIWYTFCVLIIGNRFKFVLKEFFTAFCEVCGNEITAEAILKSLKVVKASLMRVDLTASVQFLECLCLYLGLMMFAVAL